MVKSLAGQEIGRWTVQADYQLNDRGQRKWRCRCACGTERYVLEQSLRSGGSQSCGCRRREKVRRSVPNDLTGQRFGQLVALSPTPKRSGKGNVIWHCRCDCGREVDVSYNDLRYSNQISCGCRKRAHEQQLRTMQTRVDGTSLDIIKSTKVPSDNTTGCKGVYPLRGKYAAKIAFRKQVYYLGTYEKLEDAVRVRKEAEQLLFQGTVDYYAKWQQRAAQDPEWAEQNPVQICVTKVLGELQVTYLPELE